MSYSPGQPPSRDQPPQSHWPVETGSGAPQGLRAKLLPPVIAAVAGVVAAVPAVLIATAAFTQDSRPPVSTPSNPDQSLLGQVPYGSH